MIMMFYSSSNNKVIDSYKRYRDFMLNDVHCTLYKKDRSLLVKFENIYLGILLILFEFLKEFVKNLQWTFKFPTIPLIPA